MRLLGSGSLSTTLTSILTFFWFVAWIVIAVFVVLPFLGLEGTDFSMTVPITHGGAVLEKEGPGGTWSIETTEAKITVPHDRAWLGSLFALPFLLLVAFGVGQLRAIFGSLENGSPFIAANARRLRRIGLAILLFEVLHVVIMITVVRPALTAVRAVWAGGAVVQTSVWLNFDVLFLGFAVLVLAEVFRRGTAMQDEQALTV